MVIAREPRGYRIDPSCPMGRQRTTEEEQGLLQSLLERNRIHGIGFAIGNQLISHLSELPVGISEHFMTIHLVLANNKMVIAVSAYASTLDS